MHNSRPAWGLSNMLTFGSVCSGIDAASVAWNPLGWHASWFAEIEAYPSAALAHHYPRVPNLGDMTLLPGYVRARIINAPDILVGGTPCQAYSVAGLRGGLTDPRGQLTLTFVDLANAIDEQRDEDDECVIYWENVPGVLSDKTNAFGCFLAGLAGEDEPLVVPGGKWPNAGVVVGPQRAIAWRITDAQYFGVAQRRRRLFVVASARKGFDPGKLLFELDSVRRDTPPSRQAGQDVAGTLASRTEGGGFPGTDEACSGYVQPYVSTVCPTLRAGGNSTGGDRPPGTDVDTCDSLIAYAIQAGALRTNPNSGPDGVGVQEDFAYTLEARAEVQRVAYPHREVSPTLTGNYGKQVDSSNTSQGPNVIAVCVTSPVTHTLKAEGFDASEGGTGRGQPITPVLGFHVHAQPDQMRFDPHVSAALTCSQQAGVLQQLQTIWRVRRLTPRECERLQAFPDDYTLVPYRGKPAADGPRYKALGNSMCVNNMRWLGVRLILSHPEIALRVPMAA